MTQFVKHERSILSLIYFPFRMYFEPTPWYCCRICISLPSTIKNVPIHCIQRNDLYSVLICNLYWHPYQLSWVRRGKDSFPPFIIFLLQASMYCKYPILLSQNVRRWGNLSQQLFMQVFSPQCWTTLLLVQL